MEWTKGEYSITDDRDLLDEEAVGDMLRATYWAAEREQSIVAQSIETSLNFGMFRGGEFVGYARIISDFATQAYLCDVVIEESLRGQGLGSWLLECVLDHPRLATCRIDLVTGDAHEFYRKHGFQTHRYDFLVRYPENYSGGSGSNQAVD